MFKVPNPFDELVKKTTSEMLTAENWELIMEVCDRVGTDSERARQCFEVLNERMLHRNANVVLYTTTLVQSLLENCGQSVKQEVSSRAFTTTLTRVLNDKSVHEKVKSRILGSIQQWAFDFRQDPTLSLMEETYTKLRAQRFVFPPPQKPEKISTSEVERQKEEDDLQLALALSLSTDGVVKQSYQTPAAIRGEITRKQTVASGLARRTTRATSAAEPKRKVQVKALFDFAATESGELGFFKGDVIDVLDQKYRDWWKGELRGKHGIFPANFVQPMSDIRLQVSQAIDAEVQVFSEAHNIEALLRMLGSVDPMKSNVSDNTEIQKLYASMWELRPKIIKLVEQYSKKKEELGEMDKMLAKSMRLYDELMQRSVGQGQQAYGGYSGVGMAYSQAGMVPQPGMVSQAGMAPQPGMVSQQSIMGSQPGMAPQQSIMGSQPGMAPQQPIMAPQQQQPGMVPQQQSMPPQQQMYYPQQQQFAPQMYQQQHPPLQQQPQQQQPLQQQQQQHQFQQPQFQG
ncbi:ESCRT-0 subunit protein hse1 [Coemansia sp. RSA 1972]|nr:ESCRT-0 subunit protein hse1 [Coemansia sp. RSA 1972]